MPPDQLAAPMVGMSAAGEPAGSTTTSGTPRIRSSSCRVLIAEVTRMTPSDARARRSRIHSRALPERPWIDDTTVPAPAAWAASSTPRMISMAHGLRRSLKTRSSRTAREAEELVRLR